jgi:hypothetical protein
MKWSLRNIGTVFLGSLLFLAAANPAFSDIVHLDDVIIMGSACIGVDGVNGEVFDFDTLRLKENNLRIHFEDTSATAGFPTNDWRIIINDTSNGGASYFAIEDSTGGAVPFTIKAGASADTIVVDTNNKVGIGTASPTDELHVVGNAYISGDLELGSSRDFKNNIRPLELREAMDTLKALRPVKYNHKLKPAEESVGFIAEEVPDLVATNSRKSLSPDDIVAVLTKVIQDQQRTIEALSCRIEALEKSN